MVRHARARVSTLVAMRLLSVNVGMPRDNPWKPVALTGIDKRPVSGPVQVTAPGPKGTGAVGLAGDRVYDVKHHGGSDQAVYAYAREDLDEWQAELGVRLRNGVFGENLTTEGVAVNDALVGERWRIGDEVLLEVCCPRIPCGTFQGWLGRAGWIRRFTEAANNMLNEVHKRDASSCTPGCGRRPDGSHYTSSGELPLVPGIDGVGRTRGREPALLRPARYGDGFDGRADGRRSSPQRRPARRQRPGAHCCRHEPRHVRPGWHFANASPSRPAKRAGAGGDRKRGRMAVQVAKRLGAGHVIGAGRQLPTACRPHDLGADASVSLDGDPAEVAESPRPAAATSMSSSTTSGASRPPRRCSPSS